MKSGVGKISFGKIGVGLPVILLIFTVILLIALSVGRYPLPIGELLRFPAALLGWGDMSPERLKDLTTLIVYIRLPRILAAILVGSALASSGTAFQAVFRNPLVSPGILGVLGGASFGAALGILIAGNWLVVQILSFTMAVAAVAIGILIANLFGRASVVLLVLGGMISGALFTSLLSITKYMADPYNQLPTIVYWLMGNLAAANLQVTGWVSLPILAGIVILSRLGRALDALSMGDDEARTLGVPVLWVRYGIIAIATLISALTVSIAGMIGWVGLIVPHLTRLLLGPLNSRLLPASAILGAAFLLAADTLARTVSLTEIPVGIVTELAGIPCFILVLRHARRQWM